MQKRTITVCVLILIFLTPVVVMADSSELSGVLAERNYVDNVDTIQGIGTSDIDINAAKQKTQGLNSFAGKVIGFGIVIILTLLNIYIIPDMAYIMFPFVRKYLYPAYGNGSFASNVNGPGNGFATGGGMFGTGFGRYNRYGGYGGYGEGLAGPEGQQSTSYHSERQWISDAARDAVEEAFQSVTPAMTSSYGFQATTHQEKPKRKLVLTIYIKKMTLNLILCVFALLFLVSGVPFLIGAYLADFIGAVGNKVFPKVGDVINNL